MPDPITASESEQMYIVTTARLVEEGIEEPIPLSTLAQELSILPVSVNQMARKLEEAGLACYQPYKGLQLTERGWGLARRILRNRRLWEVFLVERLHLPMDEAETMACRLEHVTTGEVAERLSEHLGSPRLSPKGKSIPVLESSAVEITWLPLTALKVNQSARVVQIEASGGVRSFLSGEGIISGITIELLAAGEAGDVLIDAGGRLVHLSERLAATLLVEPEGTSSEQEEPRSFLQQGEAGEI